MLLPDAARACILENTRTLHEITLPLQQSSGFVLAEDVVADRDQPPTNRSAMDGFAVRSDDLKQCPSSLRFAGEVCAGKPAVHSVRPGNCVRVLTGAVVPEGADTVVKVEDTRESADVVMFLKPVSPGRNIRWKGEESKRGDVLLKHGTELDAVHIAICASVGKASLRVYGRPRVAVLCTGEELRDVTEAVEDHEIRDSNGPMLDSALTTCGFPGCKRSTVPDDPSVIERALVEMMKVHDVLLMTGGVSVGLYDFVPRSVERIGATIQFHKVAMKPGKPLLYATMPDNRHIFGLPGNPLSVMTCFFEYVLPALRHMSGINVEACMPRMFLPLSHAVSSDDDRTRLVISQILWGNAGPEVTPLESMGSADLTSGSRADGVVIVPAKTGVMNPGTVVEFHPWRPLP